MTKKIDPVNKVITTYNLAKAYIRFFARTLDILLLILIIGGLSFAIFNTEIIQGWQVFVLSVLVVVFFFLYFILLPFFWHGTTLFKKVFKIRTYSVLLNTIHIDDRMKKCDWKFMFLLAKKEFFIWEIWAFFFFLFGIFTFSLGSLSDEFIRFFIRQRTVVNENEVNIFTIASAIFTTMFAFTIIIDFGLLASLFVNNKKRNFHDIFSNTVVISLKCPTPPDLNNQINPLNKLDKKIKYCLPGEISASSLESSKND